jgi:hypothetical protein
MLCRGFDVLQKWPGFLPGLISEAQQPSQIAINHDHAFQARSRVAYLLHKQVPEASVVDDVQPACEGKQSRQRAICSTEPCKCADYFLLQIS